MLHVLLHVHHFAQVCASVTHIIDIATLTTNGTIHPWKITDYSILVACI